MPRPPDRPSLRELYAGPFEIVHSMFLVQIFLPRRNDAGHLPEGSHGHSRSWGTKHSCWFLFCKPDIASLTLFPIVTIRCASVAAVLSFHRIAT